MEYRSAAVILLLLASNLVLAALFVYALQRRRIPGAMPFAIAIGLSGIWSAATAAELMAADLPAKLFWANVEYCGPIFIPVAWFAMVLAYTNRGHWLSRWRLAGLMAIPLLTFTLIWTEGISGLMRTSSGVDPNSPLPMVTESFGPYFWVHTAYAYGLLLSTIPLLLSSLARSSLGCRGQHVGLLAAVALPMVSDIIYLLDVNPIPGFELTPIVFGVSGLVIARTLFQHRLFDIVPIAYDAVIAGLRDPVVVLDGRQKVVDVNPAGRVLLGRPLAQTLGLSAAEVFADHPPLVSLCCTPEEVKRRNVLIPEGEASASGRRSYDVHASSLFDTRGHRVGRVITFHDISEYRQAMEELSETLQKYQTIAENTSDLICEADSQGRYLYASPNHVEILGYDPADLVGRDCSDFIHPDDRDECIRVMQNAIGTFADSRMLFRFRHADGRWLWVESTGRSILRSTGEVVTSIITRDMSERKMAEEALIYANFHDSLTGLYNRAYFEEELRRLEGSRLYPITLVSTDVNGLKPINDTMGHRAGDELLRQYAQLVRLCLRGSDVVARVGGDEFAMVLPSTDRVTADEICQRLEELVQAHNQNNPGMPLSISWGADTSETPEVTLEEAFRTADLNMYRDKLQRKASGRHQLVGTLLAALSAKDHVSEGHTTRVREIAEKIGLAAGISREELSDLSLLAEVHDLGKVGIPDHILFKPGTLTPEERTAVEQHPAIGYKIARSSPDLAHVAELILHHHEWWNGEGYPFGMQGEEIPLACRILAVADAFDAMTNDQPYKQALSPVEGLAEVRRKSGAQFDPAVVAIFDRLFGDRTIVAVSGPPASGQAVRAAESA